MTNVLLSGYYGFGNTGDEAILASTVNALNIARPDLNIMVLSKSPEQTEGTYGVKAYPRMNPFKVFEAINSAELVVFGGGSLLQDATSLRSLIYYLSIIEISRLLRKPLVIYANGIGPITSSIGKALTKHTLTKVETITVRDIESKEELIKLGVPDKISVTADPAFLLNPAPTPIINTILEHLNINPSNNIVWISMRQTNMPTWFLYDLADTITWLRQRGYDPCFLAMQKRDIHTANAINEKLISDLQEPIITVSNVSPQNVLGLLKKAEFCIGMRLHTLILSARVGVPFVGVEIDPKIGAFCRTTNCPLLPGPATEQNFRIQDELEKFIKNKHNLQHRLQIKLPEFQALAQSNIKIILDHLK